MIYKKCGAIIDKQFDSGKAKRKIILFGIISAAVLMIAVVLAITLTPFLKNSNTKSSTSSGQITINEDLLADIGRTYGEIREKYGDPISATNMDGGTVFTFERRFGIQYDFGGGIYDGSTMIPPDNDNRCRGITADVKAIFRDFSGRKPVSDMERELSVSAAVGESNDIVDGKFCVFAYANYIIFLSLDANNEVNAEESFGQILSMELFSEFGSSTESTTSPSQISIHENLLSDIGRTYGEMRAKYGEGINISGFEGELIAEFENSIYHFRSSDIYGSAYSGGASFEAIPEDDAICYAIDTNANSLFNNFTDQYSISDMEELGISASIVFSREFPFAGEVEGEYCHFEYGNCEIDITLDVNGNEFTKDSAVYIVRKDSSDTGKAKEIQAYEAILKEYAEACETDHFVQDLYPNVNEGMMFYYHWDGNPDSFYYSYKDINNDGLDELFIGNGQYGHISIVDLYLFDGNKAVKAIDNDTLGDRSSLTLYTDGTLYETGSNSADSGIATIYRVNSSGTALEKVYDYEYVYTETGGWYYNESETISADDFYSLLNGRTEETSFNWKTLADPKA